MRKLCVVFCLLCYLHAPAQESYYVTFINGDVFNQSKHKVEVGDKVLSSEKLTFTSKTGFLIVLNEKGRYEITPVNNKTAKPNELITLLIKDNIQLHADNKRLSSRAIGGDISLQNYFKPVVADGRVISSKILIVEELKIPLKAMGYGHVDNNDDFFFLQRIDTNQNGINKKLVVRNDSLLLSKEDFMVNGKLYGPADGLLALGFVKGYSTEKNVTKIADLQPVFLSKEGMKSIIQAARLALPGVSRSDLLQEIYTELCYLYGKPDEQSIEDLL